jgi:hypothetical protein
MEDLLTLEQIEGDCTITEEKILCEHGVLEYSFDKDVAIVNSLSVYVKRNGIGTRLVNRFEMLALENALKDIEVPASPTKEAILFWNSLGYKPTAKEDIFWSKKIIRSDKDDAWDIPQGVVVLNKLL